MMLRTGTIFLFIFFIADFGHAQADSIQTRTPRFTLSGFLDVFYAHDNNGTNRFHIQPFLFSHNRHNEINLNIGLIKLSIDHVQYRGNLTLQTGTYASDNYAHEPVELRNIYEANAGISLNDKGSLWVDAGIFPSHLGFESAITSQNPTLTRSLAAENSPYYLSGVKITYAPGSKLELAAIISNGWQRIQRLPGNSMLSFGSQLMYKAGKNTTFNWSTFVGTDDPDTSRRIRYFNNLYSQFKLSDRTGLTIGMDVGFQQIEKGASSYHSWYSPVLIGDYRFNNSWKIALRSEYFSDPDGVIIPSFKPKRFQTFGTSVNLDYSLDNKLMYRLEGKWFHNVDSIYVTDENFSANQFIITTSLAISFSDFQL